MTIKDLLDVYDSNRDYWHQWLRFIDGNGETTAKIASGSEILDYIEDKEIECIAADEKDVITVWLKKGGDKE